MSVSFSSIAILQISSLAHPKRRVGLYSKARVGKAHQLCCSKAIAPMVFCNRSLLINYSSYSGDSRFHTTQIFGTPCSALVESFSKDPPQMFQHISRTQFLRSIASQNKNRGLDTSSSSIQSGTLSENSLLVFFLYPGLSTLLRPVPA